MSDHDIGRIADALERIANTSKKDSPWEIIAEVHESYGTELAKILDEPKDNFESARLLRSLQSRALSTANEIRTRIA